MVCGPASDRPEVPNLSLAHEIRHRADRVFDGRLGIDAVLVIEIDRLDPKPLQARLAGLANIRRRAVDPQGRPSGARTLPNLVAMTTASRRSRMARPTSSSLRPDTVHVGSVEEGDPEFDRAMQGGDRLSFVTSAIKIRHAHAAETDGGDFELSKSAVLHGGTPARVKRGRAYQCRGHEGGAVATEFQPRGFEQEERSASP